MEREGCSGCKSLKIPGICFVPSDEVLVAYYLKNKIEGRPLQCNHLIAELKIYDDVMMPWEVLKDDNPYWITSCNDSSKNKIKKKTIYVFTELRKKKSRVMRRSGRGSWTGQNNSVVKDKAGNDIGFNKLLTFYEDNNDDKKGKKKMISSTDDEEHGNWIMHEYSLIGIDNYVVCKITKEVKMNAKAASILMCPSTKAAAAATQDFHSTQGDADITNVVLDDERQLGGGDDQTLDWEYNGWMKELYHQLDDENNNCDVKELAIDGQEDVQIPNFLIEEEEEEAIDVNVYQPSGADLENNAWNTTVGSVGDHNQTGTSSSMSDDTSAAVGGVQELPVMEYIWQDNLNFSLVAQEVPTVAVCGKNGQSDDDSYKGLDGAGGNHDIIILDDNDSCTGVDDQVQEVVMIEIAEDAPPQIQGIINVDNQEDNRMEGSDKQNIDDFFWNFELVGADHSVSPMNTAWDDVILDFSSPELFDLWGTDETNERSSIFEGQSQKKRMRYGDQEDWEECPSGKTQRCL